MKTISAFLIIIYSAMASAQAPTLDAQGASIAIENQEANIKINKDGSSETVTKLWMRALSDTGRKELSLQKITYDPLITEVKLLEAGLDQDGQTILVPLNQVVVTEENPQKSGISKMKSLQIPFSGVKMGGVIWYKYQEKQKRSVGTENFSLSNVFGFLQPELKGFTKIESALPLDVQAFDPKKEIEIKQTKSSVGYELTMKILKPQFSLNMNEFRELSLDEIRDRVPRVHIEIAKTWEGLVAKEKSRYDSVLKEPLPATLNSFLAGLSAKTVEEKAEAVFLWLAENMTYSGRWLAPGSGYEPRKISEILKGHVGDCKDFAVLTLAFFKALKIEAEPTYVGAFSDEDRSYFLREPIDESKPMPSTSYFNHVIVRYRNGSNWSIVDPGRGLGDVVHTPFMYNQRWALALGSSGSPAWKIKVSTDGDYAKATLQTAFKKKPDGNFAVESKVQVQGELSNFLKGVYFSQGEELFRSYLGIFASAAGAQNVQVSRDLKPDRSSKPWSFTINYTVPMQMRDGKVANSVKLPPAYLPSLAMQGERKLFFPIFPMEVLQTTSIQDSFARNEIENECLVRGPMLFIDRRVQNRDGNVLVTERTLIPVDPTHTKTKLDRNLAGLHMDYITSCFARSEIALEKYEKGNLKQVGFEGQLDLTKPFDENQGNDHSSEFKLKQIRTLDAYLAKNPKDLTLMRKRAWAVGMFGYYNSEDYIQEYLQEAKKTFQDLLKVAPNDEKIHSNLGSVELYMHHTPEALAAFGAAYKLNPKEYKVLRLGAKISERMKNFENAYGYYRAAAASATNPVDKSNSLYDQAAVQCWELKKCKESLPVVEQSIALGQTDAWTIHNGALIYQMAEDHKKVIELERKALSLMKFGAAQGVLVKSLVAESYSIAQHSSTATEFKMAEDYLLEAYKYDNKDGATLYTLVFLYSNWATQEKNISRLENAEQYFREFASSRNRPDLLQAAQERLMVTQIRLGRTPASDGSSKPRAASSGHQ